MAVQTTYSIEHAVAYAGMLADEQIFNSVSKLNADTVTIPYGKGVVTSGEEGAILPVPASTAAQFIGVAMRELNRAYADGDTFGAPVDRDFTVVTHGVIWVTVLDTVAKDAPVYLRVGATGAGDFSGVVGTGATLGVLVAGAKFLTGGDAGDLVKVSLGIGG
jgi:hypothetical protein